MASMMIIYAFCLQMTIGFAANCFPEVTWPKLIGYGKADTEVVSISRCSSSGELALILQTEEADLVGNDSTNKISISKFNPDTEQYSWFKVLNKVNWNNEGPYVLYTPDCSKILTYYSNTLDESKPKMVYMYFNPTNGEFMQAFSKNACCADVYHKSAFVMSDNGDRIYSIHNRPRDSLRTAVLNRIEYDATTNSFTNYVARQWVRYWEKQGINSKFSLDLTPDDRYVLTSTSVGYYYNKSRNGDCSLNLWDKDFVSNTAPLIARNEGTIEDRHCIFTKVLQRNDRFFILQLTEYFSEKKAGFIRSELSEKYNFINQKQDEEKFFTKYQLTFRCAFYPSPDLAYAMAIDTDSLNYLIKFNWGSNNADIYSIKGFDPSPNTTGVQGTRHMDALIYEENSNQPGNFPIKGYMVGGTKAIQSYNDQCNKPNFGIENQFYELLTATHKYGFVDRIELHDESCKKENTSVVQVTLASAFTRQGDKALENVHDAKEQDNTFAYVDQEILDITAASQSGISVQDWEKSQTKILQQCKDRTSSLENFTMTDAIFAQDKVTYLIGSGPLDVPITTDWKISDGTGTCDTTFKDYKTYEKLEGAQGVTNNFSIIDPTLQNQKVQLEIEDSTQHQVNHVISVLAIISNWQCAEKSFTVTPYYCPLATYSNTQWNSPNSAQPLQLSMDYKIGTTINEEIFEFTISEPLCDVKVLLVEVDSQSGESVHDDSIVRLTNDIQVSAPQFLYKAQIYSTRMDLDPGYAASPTQEFRAIVSTTDQLDPNRLIFSLFITYEHPCRFVEIEDQIYFPMEAMVSYPDIIQKTQPIKPFVLNPILSTCGPQVVEIIDQASYPFLEVNGQQLILSTSDMQHANVYTDIQLKFELPQYEVAHNNAPTFNVTITIPCHRDTFKPVLWDQTSSDKIETYEKILLSDDDTFTFSSIVNTISFCPTRYYFVQQKSGSFDDWVDYDGDVFKLFKDEQKVVIHSSTDHESISNQILQFRIAVASVQDLSSAIAPAFLELSVILEGPCPLMKIHLDHNYRAIEVEELFKQELKMFLRPALSKSSTGMDCGPLVYNLDLKDASKISSIIHVTENGDIVVQRPQLGHAGFYSGTLTISLQQYPTVSTSSPVWINIFKCQPTNLIAPQPHDEIFEFYIGDKTSVIGLRNFIQASQCPDVSPLTQKLTFVDGRQLHPAMGLHYDTSGQTPKLICDCKDVKYKGLHHLKISAEYDSGQYYKLHASYEIQVNLIAQESQATDESSEELEVSYLADEEISYQLPNTYKTNYQVTIAEELGYFIFDEKNLVISSQTAPVGKYKFTIILRNNDPLDPKIFAQDLTINVLSELTEPIRGDFYAIPYIKSITTFGEVFVQWDRPMKLPTNQTHYGKMLKESILVKNTTSGEKFHVPALEVSYEPSFAQETLIQMQWEFVKWNQPNQMQLQLNFDKTELVSMKVPQDKLRIKFWNQKHFQAQDGSFVEYEKTLEDRLFSQSRNEVLADATHFLLAIALVAVIMACCVSLCCTGMALTRLWTFIHAIQIIVQLPLFATQIPGLVFVVYEKIFNFLRLLILKTGETVSCWFSLANREEAYSEELEISGFIRKTDLAGSGFLIPLILLGILPVLLSIILTYPAKKLKTVAACKEAIDNIFKWNYTLRLLYETTLDIAVLAMVETYILDLNSWEYKSSFGLIIFLFACLFGLALFSRFYVRRVNINDRKIAKRIGTIYDGLIRQKSSLIQPEWFIYRRIAFAVFAIYGVGHLWLQFLILFNSSFITIAIIERNIYEFQGLKIIELVNEGFILIMQYHLLIFTQLVHDSYWQNNAGLSCVIFTYACIVLNLTVIIIVTIKNVFLYLRRCKNSIRNFRQKSEIKKQLVVSEPYQIENEKMPNSDAQTNQVLEIKNSTGFSPFAHNLSILSAMNYPEYASKHSSLQKESTLDSGAKINLEQRLQQQNIELRSKEPGIQSLFGEKKNQDSNFFSPDYSVESATSEKKGKQLGESILKLPKDEGNIFEEAFFSDSYHRELQERKLMQISIEDDQQDWYMPESSAKVKEKTEDEFKIRLQRLEIQQENQPQRQSTFTARNSQIVPVEIYQRQVTHYPSQQIHNQNENMKPVQGQMANSKLSKNLDLDQTVQKNPEHKKDQSIDIMIQQWSNEQQRKAKTMENIFLQNSSDSYKSQPQDRL